MASAPSSPVAAPPKSAAFWPCLTLGIPFLAFLILLPLIRVDTVVPFLASFYIATALVAGTLLGLLFIGLLLLVMLPGPIHLDPLRRLAGWRALHFTLLATLSNLFLSLVFAFLGLTTTIPDLSILTFASLIGASFGLLISGALFALLVANLAKPETNQ